MFLLDYPTLAATRERMRRLGVRGEKDGRRVLYDKFRVIDALSHAERVGARVVRRNATRLSDVA